MFNQKIHKKGENCTEAMICGICAECEETLFEGEIAYLLGDKLYCPACVRGALTAVGIYPVVPPQKRSDKIQKAVKIPKKRLYFKERTDRI